LSSEYGWTLHYILNEIYIDELLGLLESIENRKRRDALLLLMITHNPHVEDPNRLFRELSNSGFDTRGDKIDREGLKKLKGELSKKSKLIKIKK